MEPLSGSLPEQIRWDAQRASTLVLLLDTGTAADWAAASAAAIADQWAETGRRVVLMDLHLREPLLHRYLQLEVGEGISDSVFRGVPLSRCVRRVPERKFHLVSAGTEPADPEAVLASPQWARLVDGFRRASVSLLVFVPPTLANPRVVFDAAEEIILLGNAEDLDAAIREAAAASPVRAHLSPAPIATPPPALTAGAPRPASGGAHRTRWGRSGHDRDGDSHPYAVYPAAHGYTRRRRAAGDAPLEHAFCAQHPVGCSRDRSGCGAAFCVGGAGTCCVGARGAAFGAASRRRHQIGSGRSHTNRGKCTAVLATPSGSGNAWCSRLFRARCAA